MRSRSGATLLLLASYCVAWPLVGAAFTTTFDVATWEVGKVATAADSSAADRP